MGRYEKEREEARQALEWAGQAKEMVKKKILDGPRPDPDIMLTMPQAYQQLWKDHDDAQPDWVDILDPPKS